MVLGRTLDRRSLVHFDLFVFLFWYCCFVFRKSLFKCLLLQFPLESWALLHHWRKTFCIISLHLRQRTLYKSEQTCSSSCWYFDWTLPPASLLSSECSSHTPLCMVRTFMRFHYWVYPLNYVRWCVCFLCLESNYVFCWHVLRLYLSSLWKGSFHCSFMLLGYRL